MSSNHNISPYFDDFTPSNNFYKVLFNAGRPVQARELNQLQSILQNQTAIMASNIFKNGSRIYGGNISFNQLSWVRLQDGSDISWYTENCIAIGVGDGSGNGSGVEGRVIAVTPETTEDPATIFVVYQKVGVDGEATHFIHGEQLKIVSDDDRLIEISDSSNRPVVRCPSCPGSTASKRDDVIKPTGNKAKQIVVEEGAWYWNGHFVETKRQELIYSKYGDLLTCKLGFDVNEEIVTHEDDASLYDNALGYPNETAPGADRYKISFTLNKRTSTPQDGSRYIIVAEVEEGIVTHVVNETQYNKIMDTMAQRTYEESGNYTVTPFRLSYIEHKAAYKGDPLGGNVKGNEEYLRAIVTPGIAYVNGYRHEKIANSIFDVRKARNTVKREDGTIYFSEQAYVDLIVDTTQNSAWSNNPGIGYSLFTDEMVELKDGEVVGNAATGNTVGRMKVWDVVQRPDNANGDKVFRYYVTDVELNQGKSFTDVKSVSNLTSNFAAKPEKVFEVINEANKSLFWTVTTPLVKSMREVDNPDKGSVYLSRRIKLNATLDSQGNYTWDSSANLFNAGLDTAILLLKDGGVWKSWEVKGNLSTAANSVTVSLGASHNGKDVMVIITGFAVNLVEKQKTLVQNESVTFTKAATNHFKENLKLKKADVIRIKKIVADGNDLVTGNFKLNTGQTPTAYRESFLEVITELQEDKYNSIEVTFDYFSHSDTSQSGFFSIDSYNKVIEADDNDYTYANLPYVLDSAGNQYSVAQIVDFRPMILDNNVSTSYMPALGSTMIHDVEFYVPRKDLVVIDKDGKIYQKEGIPAVNPEFPEAPPNTMTLFNVFIPAYTFSYKDVKVTKVENKRYTMRDIGKLEKRIDSLEYYTTLSLAEKAVQDSKIKDANGLDRFKNGFIVDNFVDYSVADTASNEFKCLKDEIAKALRPNTFMHNRNLVLDKGLSENFHERGGVLTLPYKHVVIDQQPFGTKSVSINECYMFRRKGKLILFPNHNTWSDITREAKQEWNIDTGTEAIKGLSEQINKVQKDFNDFQVANATVTKPVKPVETKTTVTRQENISNLTPPPNPELVEALTALAVQHNLIEPGAKLPDNIPAQWSAIDQRFTQLRAQTQNQRRLRSTTTTTNTAKTITDQASKIGTQTTTYSFDRVTDVKILPYMKETTIEFLLTGMLPNTKMYVFMDDVDLSHLMARKISATQNADKITDENGVLKGIMHIPAGQFLNGTKTIKFTNDKTNSGDEDVELCYATAQFYAGGLDVSKQEIDLNITTPTLSWEEVQSTAEETRSTTSATIEERFNPQTGKWEYVPPPPPPNTDPVAQSFTLNQNTFISKIDLYFHLKDTNASDTIWVEIRKMTNGYPVVNAIAKKDILVKDIQVSEDASVPTTVEFDTPVYVNGGEEYCFVIGGNSPMTKVWVAKLGGEAVNFEGKLVDTQPSTGSRFRSQNGSTWNAEQFEDIMYTMYAAEFSDKPMKLVFTLKDDPNSAGEEILPANCFEFEAGSRFMRVHTFNGHALNKNDKVIISTVSNKWVNINVTSGQLQIGHTLTFPNGRAKVSMIQYPDSNPANVKVLLTSVIGYIKNGDTFVSDSFTGKQFSKEEFLIDKNDTNEFNAVVSGGSVISGLEDTDVKINGISLANINGEFTVVSADDYNSFVIKLDTAADKTGRFGWAGATAVLNHKFEMLNLSGSRMVYDGEEVWTVKALKHGAEGSIYEGDNYGYGDAFKVQMNENKFFERPYKLASKLNENSFAGNNSSIVVETSLIRNANEKYVTPIVNMESLSVTMLSNNVTHLSAETAKEPNKTEVYKPETHKSQGTEGFKYVTRTVTLKNPAQDLKIWFDVNRPLNTDFDIYIKTSEQSGQQLDDKDWMLLEGYEKGVTHNDQTEFTEIEILTSDILQEKLKMFTTFKLKIVCRSKNSAKYPLIKALRVVAVT